MRRVLPVQRWSDYPRGYFNQAGSGPASPGVRRLVAALDTELARLGGHSAAGLALIEQQLDTARGAVSAPLGLPPDWTVSFGSSATDLLNLVAEGLAAPRHARVVVSDQEHPSGLLSLAKLRDRGYRVDVLASEPATSWLERAADARRGADLLLASQVSYRSGRAQRVAALPPGTGDDGLLLVDVSQALGQVSLDGLWRAADLVVGLGHKWLHGPLPIGFLLAGPRARERLAVPRGGWHARTASNGFWADWRQDGGRFEPGSPDAARVAGLRLAFERQLPGLLAPPARRRVVGYRARVLAALDAAGHAALPGSVAGLLLVPTAPRPARAVAAAFLALGLTVKDLNPPECPDLLRISLTPLHRPEEVDDLCRAIPRVLADG